MAGAAPTPRATGGPGSAGGPGSTGGPGGPGDVTSPNLAGAAWPAYGLALRAPAGWRGEVYRRPQDVAGESTYPILHACTRALPARRGDFGVGVVELLGPGDVFVAVVEYAAALAGRGLFAGQGRPPLAPSQFGTDRLQRVVPGRSAAQHFYTEAGRAFCLFVVLGSHGRRMALVPRAVQLLAGLTVTDRATLLRRNAS